MRLLPLLALLVGCAAPDTAGVDPLEGEDVADGPRFGPDNRWPSAREDGVPASLSGTGEAAGDVAADFVLGDQFGDDVQLYQFYGDYVVLMIFAQWCTTCRREAADLQAFWVEQAAEDAVVIALMEQDSDRDSPQTADLQAWADAYGLTHPVLADDGEVASRYHSGSYPTIVLIGRDMVIDEADHWPFAPEAIEDDL